VSSDALGNFVVATPLLQLLRSQFKPESIDYYGGVRTWELQKTSDLFDWSYPFHGSAPSELATIASQRRGYDLVVNIERASSDRIFAGSLATASTFVCGPCSDVPGHELEYPNDEQGKLWADRDWTAKDLTARHPILQSGFIGEILCRACYLEGAIPPYKVPCEEPARPIPPILISTAGSTQEKLWPAANWLEMLEFFAERKLEVGLLGAHPNQQQLFWKGNEGEDSIVAGGLVTDLRGKLTLPEVVGALKAADLVLTLDNGILHLAVAAGKRTVGIFRNGIHRLWAPPATCLTVVVPDEGLPVSSLPVEVVREAVSRAI
jgi:ADP-heptose:LPS heptosyltransferase